MHNSISILFTIECKKIFAHTVWSGEPLHTVSCLTSFNSVGVLSFVIKSNGVFLALRVKSRSDKCKEI